MRLTVDEDEDDDANDDEFDAVGVAEDNDEEGDEVEVVDTDDLLRARCRNDSRTCVEETKLTLIVIHGNSQCTHWIVSN